MSVDIIHGDCMDALQYFRSNSFDSCVTDPPYNLESIKKRFGGSGAAAARTKQTGVYARQSKGFMGKTWDSDVAFQPEMWAEVYRVLKPGAHVLAFGGSRTYHRLASAIEDAGFEIRDQIMWLYGSGFPKSHNLDGDWQGWGTALKPAHEPIVLARKPLIGTVAANVAAWGVGAVNIDGCRVALSEGDDPRLGGKGERSTSKVQSGVTVSLPRGTVASSELGRFPANVIHDGSDEVLAGFPAQAGAGGKASGPTLRDGNTSVARGKFNGLAAGKEPAFHNDSGSAARFFYCAKASRSDRNDGLAEFAKKPLLWSAGTKNPGSFQSEGTEKAAQNPHPTVKPTDLMRYLCRLITPPGGHVLDPFLGSGSTGRGAVMEGFDFTGIELTEEYVPIARARIAAVHPRDIFA
jgi:site-specific DNA-methyltransferase (adenine-specific)